MSVELGYTPLDCHKPFHASAARYKCMVGGYASGKSLALCWEAIMFALEQPGSDMILARKYAPSLKDSTEAIFFDCLPQALLDAALAANPRAIVRLGGHVSSFQFHNGTLLKFKGIDDWKKEKSQNVAWIGWDEADEQAEATVVGMASRLRQTRPLKVAVGRGYETRVPMRRQCCLATNPAGRNWVWKRFINPDTKWDNAEGFISTTLDNPHMPLDFVLDQMSKGVAYVKRYVLCLFDEQAGSIYPTWGREHQVDYSPPRDSPPDLWMVFDPGSTKINPSAALWVALDRARGRMVAVAEYSEWDLPAEQHARNWQRIELRLREKGYGPVTWRVADPGAINVRDRGANNKLSDIYRRYGYAFEPAYSNRHADRIPPLGELVDTHKFVHTDACPLLHAQMEAYRWEDQLPQHVDLGEYREKVKKGNDHLVDCGQYLAARWVRRDTSEEQGAGLTEMQHFERELRAAMRRDLTVDTALPDGVAV